MKKLVLAMALGLLAFVPFSSAWYVDLGYADWGNGIYHASFGSGSPQYNYYGGWGYPIYTYPVYTYPVYTYPVYPYPAYGYGYGGYTTCTTCTTMWGGYGYGYGYGSPGVTVFYHY